MWLPLAHIKAQFTLHLDHSCLATCAKDTPRQKLLFFVGVRGASKTGCFTLYLVIGVKLGRAGWLRPGDIAEDYLDLQRVWCVCLGGRAGQVCSARETTGLHLRNSQVCHSEYAFRTLCLCQITAKNDQAPRDRCNSQ